MRPFAIGMFKAGAASLTTEHFDSVTAPALPATLSFDSPLVTSAEFAVSGPNAIKLTGSAGTTRYAETTAVSAADGNVEVSVTGKVKTGALDTATLWAINSIAASMLGAAATGTAYGLLLPISDTGLALYKWTAGTLALVKALTIVAPVPNVLYTLTLRRAYDANGNGWLSGKIKRVSDSAHLTPNSQDFEVGTKGWAIEAYDGSIAAGARKGGLAMQTANAADTSYLDDFTFTAVRSIDWHAMGDSITYGRLASNGGFPLLLESLLNKSVQNHGYPGAQAVDVANDMYTFWRGGHKSTIYVGTNDFGSNGYGASATKEGYFKSALMAMICRASFDTIVKAQAMTASAGWTDAGAGNYDGVTTRFSNTNGATLTFTASGDAIFVGFSGADDTYDGTFKVTVDGVDLAVGATATPGIKTSPGFARVYYCPQMLLITGCGAGSHTVVITTTNGTGNHYSFIDWGAGIDSQSALARVLVGNINYLSAAGYLSFGGSDGLIDTYNTKIASAIALLAAAGVNVGAVDLNTTFNTATMLGSDSIHPNNTGQANHAARFFAAM